MTLRILPSPLLPPMNLHRMQIHFPSALPSPSSTLRPALLAITGIVGFIAGAYFLYIKFLNFDEFSKLNLGELDELINVSSIENIRIYYKEKEKQELEEQKKELENQTQEAQEALDQKIRELENQIKELQEQKEKELEQKTTDLNATTKKQQELENQIAILQKEIAQKENEHKIFTKKDNDLIEQQYKTLNEFQKNLEEREQKLEEKEKSQRENNITAIEKLRRQQAAEVQRRRVEEALKSNVEINLNRLDLSEDTRSLCSVQTLIEMYSLFYVNNLIQLPEIACLVPEDKDFPRSTRTLRWIITAALNNPSVQQKFYRHLFTHMNPYTMYEQIVAILAKHHWVAVPSLSHLTHNLKQQFSAISKSLKTRNGTISKSFPKLPFVLSKEIYKRKEETEFSTKRLHVPYPFETEFSPLFSNIEKPQKEFYKTFVRSLDVPFGCFLLQEGTISPLEENENVHVFLLPTKIFDTDTQEINNTYKTQLIKNILDANPTKMSKENLEYLFDQTKSIFFYDKKTLTKPEQSIVLMLFYSLIELFYTAKFKLAYKHVCCKHTDFQTTLNTISMVLQALLVREPYLLRQIQVLASVPLDTTNTKENPFLLSVLEFLIPFSKNATQVQALQDLISTTCSFQSLDIPQGNYLLAPTEAKTLEQYKLALLLDTFTHRPICLKEVPTDSIRDFLGNSFFVDGKKMKNETELEETVKDKEALGYFSQEILVEVSKIYRKHYENNNLLHQGLQFYAKMHSRDNPVYCIDSYSPNIRLDSEKREITADRQFYIPIHSSVINIHLFVTIFLKTQTCVVMCKTYPNPKQIIQK